MEKELYNTDKEFKDSIYEAQRVPTSPAWRAHARSARLRPQGTPHDPAWNFDNVLRENGSFLKHGSLRTFLFLNKRNP